MSPQSGSSRGLLAGKINSRHDARVVAESLIPIKELAQDGDQFFARAACTILAETIVALHILSPRTWRLKDLASSVRSPERLRSLLNTTRDGRRIFTTYLSQSPEVIEPILTILNATFGDGAGRCD